MKHEREPFLTIFSKFKRTFCSTLFFLNKRTLELYVRIGNMNTFYCTRSAYTTYIFLTYVSLFRSNGEGRWRIQDFPDVGGANPKEAGANLLFGQFSLKTPRNTKFGPRRGERVPCEPPPPPPNHPPMKIILSKLKNNFRFSDAHYSSSLGTSITAVVMGFAFVILLVAFMYLLLRYKRIMKWKRQVAQSGSGSSIRRDDYQNNGIEEIISESLDQNGRCILW